MGEFLVSSPLNLPFVTSVLIVMSTSESVIKSLCEVNLLNLRERGASELYRSIVVLKVNVEQMSV